LKWNIRALERDKGKHPVLICAPCLEQVTKANEVQEIIKNSEKFYFAKLREHENRRATVEAQEYAGEIVQGILLNDSEMRDFETLFEDERLVEEIEKMLEGSAEIACDEGPEQEVESQTLNVAPKDLEGEKTNGGIELKDPGWASVDHAEEIDKENQTPPVHQQRKSDRILRILRERKQEISTKSKKGVKIKTNQNVDKTGVFIPCSSSTKVKFPRTYNKSNRFNCPKCSKDFSSKQSLCKHIQAVHDKKTRFECDFCPKVFFSRGNIVWHLCYHLIAKRKTPKTFPKPAVMTTLHCSICYKLLANKQNLRSHIDAVHEKKVNFSCDLCPRQFYNKSKLKRHMTTHIFTNDDTSNSDRPFKCNFKNCGKFYKTQHGLRQHQQCHSGKCEFVFE
jgi:hypothetical protein